MKDYVISYTHSLGCASIMCYRWEVASVLRNITHLALQGHSFDNVTIKRV